MKKIKMISVAAAALLTVAPIISTSIVNAADTTQVSTDANLKNPPAYFTYNGQRLANGATVPIGNGIPVKSGVTVGELIKEATNAVKLESSVKEATVDQNTASVFNVISHLQRQGFKVNGTDENAIVEIPDNTIFNIELSGRARTVVDGKTYASTQLAYVNVPFNSGVSSVTAPAISVSFGNHTIPLNNLTFQVASNSNFDPTDFTGTNGEQFKISASKGAKLTVDSNTVDTSKPGTSGEVKLTATNDKGEKFTTSYRVFVKPTGLYQLNLPSDWVYGAPFAGDTMLFYQGEKYYIGNLTKLIDGQFYTSVDKRSEAKANDPTNGYWIPTKYLANPNPTKIVKKTIMHKAKAYTRGGGSTRKVYSAYTEVYVKSEPVHYTNGDYYQIYNADGTYTNYFVKIGNIDGTKRTLKHNAYVYATSKRRADRTLLRKGQTITTYGGSYKFKNGKRYYRVEGATPSNKRYVKVANFK